MYVLTSDKQMWKFEKEDSRWLWQPNLPSNMAPRSDAGYWKIRGKFYLYGGISTNGGIPLDDMWIYDFYARDFMQELQDISNPGPCYGMTTWTHEPSNRILFWGGICQNVTNNKIYGYDTTLNQWSVVNSGVGGPVGSLYGAAVLSGTTVYLYTQDQLWSFDMTSGKWSWIPSPIMPTGPNRTHMILWSNSESILLYGGQSGSQLFGDTWTYNAATNSWRIKATDGPIARYGMAYCVDTNGYLNMFGGSDGLYVLNDLWQYGPFTVKTVVDMVQWKLDSATIMATWAAASSTIVLGIFTVLVVGFCIRKCLQKKEKGYPLGNLNQPIYVGQQDVDMVDV
jgi:hypothetical protein